MSTSEFSLHKQLQADSAFVTDLPLSRVLLINDSNYPWCVLVPMRAGATEIYKLSNDDQAQLLKESSLLCNVLESQFAPDKMNVAAIGNMVPQLHIHHIARFKTDIAWPAPVWGFTSPVPYEPKTLEETVNAIGSKLARVAS